MCLVRKKSNKNTHTNYGGMSTNVCLLLIFLKIKTEKHKTSQTN